MWVPKGWVVVLWGSLCGPWAALSEVSKMLGLRGGFLGSGSQPHSVSRLQQLDEENGELRSCTPCLKANIERLEEVSCQPEHRAGKARLYTVWAPKSAGLAYSFPGPSAPDAC